MKEIAITPLQDGANNSKGSDDITIGGFPLSGFNVVGIGDQHINITKAADMAQRKFSDFAGIH